MSYNSYNYGTQPELLELENRNSGYTRIINNKINDGLEILAPSLISHR